MKTFMVSTKGNMLSSTNLCFDKRADIHQWDSWAHRRWMSVAEISVQEGAWEEMEREPEGKGQTKGIVCFWLWEHLKILCSMTQGNDELAPEHPKDVKLKFSESGRKPMSFTLKFLFKSKEYFSTKFWWTHTKCGQTQMILIPSSPKGQK